MSAKGEGGCTGRPSMDSLLGDEMSIPAPIQPADHSNPSGQGAMPLTDALEQNLAELESRIEQLPIVKKPSVEVSEDGRDFKLIMQSETTALVEGNFIVNRVPYKLSVYADLNEDSGRWEPSRIYGWRTSGASLVQPTAAAETAVTEKLHEWISPAVSRVLSGDGYKKAVTAGLRSQLSGDRDEMRKILDDRKDAELRASDSQLRARKHLAAAGEDISSEPTSESLDASISIVEGHIEQMGRSPMPSLQVNESGREFELEMASDERAYIDGTITVDRVPYRVRITSDFNHVAGRWEMAGNDLIWRADNQEPVAPKTRARIAENLDEWISPSVEKALGGEGLEQAMKSSLKSELVADLHQMKKARGDVKNTEIRAANTQTRTRKHLRRLDETQQPSPLAEIL